MPFDNGPWENPESELEAGDYCAVCLIDTNEGRDKVKSLCKLPIRKRPGGAINVNAVHAAAAALAGARGGLTGVTPEEKRKAARKLLSLYREMKEEAPESVYRIAGEKPPAK